MNPHFLLEHAQRLLSSGRYEKAANCLRELLTTQPHDPELHLLHAEARRRSGQLAEAAISYAAAAERFAAQGDLERARNARHLGRELRPDLSLSPIDEPDAGHSTAAANNNGPEVVSLDQNRVAVQRADGRWVLIQSSSDLRVRTVSAAELSKLRTEVLATTTSAEPTELERLSWESIEPRNSANG